MVRTVLKPTIKRLDPAGQINSNSGQPLSFIKQPVDFACPMVPARSSKFSEGSTNQHDQDENRNRPNRRNSEGELWSLDEEPSRE